MKKTLIRFLLFLAVVLVAPTLADAVTDTITCQNVSTTPVEVLAFKGARTRWAIWTTSGAPTIYFNQNGTATARGTNSGPLVAGQSYTEENAAVNRSAVSAVTASGTAWVCTKEAVGQ